MRLLWLITAAACLSSPSSSSPIVRDNKEQKCNGYSELCHRRYSDITWIGTHNAPFTGHGFADNQHMRFDDQLKDGIRFLTIRTRGKHHKHLKVCHGKCLYRDAGRLKKFLIKTKSFLEDNPNEVVTLLLTNPDHQDIGRFQRELEKSGLDELAYVGKEDGSRIEKEEWPTLRELIDMNKRAIIFLGVLCSPP